MRTRTHACTHARVCMHKHIHARTFFDLALPASVRDVQHNEVDDHEECEHNEANQHITGKQIPRACPRLSSQIWPLLTVFLYVHSTPAYLPDQVNSRLPTHSELVEKAGLESAKNIRKRDSQIENLE